MSGVDILEFFSGVGMIAKLAHGANFVARAYALANLPTLTCLEDHLLI